MVRDHSEGRCKIQDNYKSELFMVVLNHKDPKVYTINLLCGGLVHTVNQQQLFDLRKSSLGDSGDSDPTSPSSSKANLPFYQPKKLQPDTPHQHPYGMRSKTQNKAVFQMPDLNEDNMEVTGWRLLESMFTPWV